MNAPAISLSGLTFHPNPAEYNDQHPVQWIKPMFSPQVYYGSYVSNFNSQFDKMKDLPYEATKSSQTPTTLTIVVRSILLFSQIQVNTESHQ